MFSEDGCAWCERARREFLLPMLRNAGYRARVDFVQVDVDNDRPLTDFSGRPSTHAAVARVLAVKLVPTVMLFGAKGERLTDPLRGFAGGSDYYGFHLDQRIDAAVGAIGRRAAPTR